MRIHLLLVLTSVFGCTTTANGPLPECELDFRFGDGLDGLPIDHLDHRDNDCDGEVDEDVGILADEGEGEAESEGEAGQPEAPGADSCLEDQDCDDSLDCTQDVCSVEGCLHFDRGCEPVEPEVCVVSSDSDCDNDGVTPRQGDCDDEDPNRSPLILEDAEHENLTDGIDNDCDIVSDEWGPGDDRDGDKVRNELDCDPENPDRWPGAPEICGDGIDSDCNGEDNTDQWGSCFFTVGVIDGLDLPGTGLIRIAVEGDIRNGLVGVPRGDILSVSATIAPNWDDSAERAYWRGNQHPHGFHVSRAVPFLPRIRAQGGPVNFDLREWNLTGILHRIPAPTGRWGTVLVP